jgi:peptidoglycan lytic transglycosylase
MGRGGKCTGLGRIARIGVIAACGLALAQCSSGNFAKSRYSQKMIADGEPVPKGGGRYSVGQPYYINGKTYVPTENPNYRAEGVASWYGPDFHGRLTANGEIYDMNSISAAHTTMPLPSYARVTNLTNSKSIIVRVNDRGPYARERIIDVSIGTAKALGFYGSGVAPVRVEYVGRAPIEGSDDTMLMATLREGNPAPAPSRIMVASAKPFLSGESSARAREPEPAEVERERLVGSASPKLVLQSPDPPARAQARSAVRLPDSARPDIKPADQARVSRAGLAPPSDPIGGLIRSDPSLGLMSARGLY